MAASELHSNLGCTRNGRNECSSSLVGTRSEHRPVLIVIAGPNGSGKTSVTSKILHHDWLEDSEYINPDNVARDVFGDWNNQESVLKAANYCNEWRERCLAERKSHIFETVMSATDKVDYILRAKAAGFFIRLFFVSTESPTINAKRVANRVLNGGHDVPIPKIISRYDKSIANCIALAPDYMSMTTQLRIQKHGYCSD